MTLISEAITSLTQGMDRASQDRLIASTAPTYISDPDDFCRACGGQGGDYEKTERGTNLWEPCWHCGGSGKKSVRIGTADPE